MKNTILIVVCSLTLMACGGRGDLSDLAIEQYTDAEGNPLVVCHNTTTIIYEPQDAAHLEGCQVILGTVYIQPQGEHASLSEFHLDEVVHIEGHLEIADSNSLETIDGLDNLESVSDAVLILYNTQLTAATGFPKLKQANYVQVNLNDALTELAFPKLVETGNIVVSANESLERIQFPSLTTITESLVVTSNVALTNMAFPAIASVDEVAVSVNGAFADIDSLAGL